MTGTRQPLALLESLLDADALSKAREAAPAQRASAADAPLCLGGAQIVKPTPEELACGTLTDALVCRIAAKEVA